MCFQGPDPSALRRAGMADIGVLRDSILVAAAGKGGVTFVVEKPAGEAATRRQGLTVNLRAPPPLPTQPVRPGRQP